MPPWTLTTCGQVFSDSEDDKAGEMWMEGDIDDFDDDNIGGGDYNLCTGNDVYFECDVRANPIPHKLIWLHNVSLVM